MNKHSNRVSWTTTARRRCLQGAGVLVLLGLSCGLSGCTRAFYRKATDKEVNDILVEKDQFSAWKIEQFHVYPDSRARFADQCNPDRPPMPPDDDATWKMSPHPQRPGKQGVGDVHGSGYLEIMKLWDTQNRAERQSEENIEEPAPAAAGNPRLPLQAYLDEPTVNPDKGFLLNLEQAIELGVINSREYQNFREQLYQAALPVTQERFSFAYQWVALADFIRQWAGPQSAVGAQNNWTVRSTLGFSKLFSTGALLTLDFANTTVFNFAGPGHGVTSGSTINLNVVQPLLQGGGQAVTLEPLTQAERNLFYSVRAFARFREQFNVSVALGSSLPGSLASAAGISAGATAGSSPISSLAALGIASTDVSGGLAGYLPTLYRECDMAADKKLVHDLQRALLILEGYQEGGMFSPLQVDQVRSTLLQAQNTVLNDRQFLANALDQFKLALGLPANLPLLLDDTPARPITRQLDRYYEVIDDSDAAYKSIEKQEKLPPEKLRAALLQTFTRSSLVRGLEFQKKVPLSWSRWEKLNDNDLKAELQKLADQRRKMLDLKTELELKGQVFSIEQIQSMNEADFEADLGGLEVLLRRYALQPWTKQANEGLRQLDRTRLFRLVSRQAQFVLVWARNERFAEVNNQWPEPPPVLLDQLDLVTADVELAQETVTQAALSNRWDLMNARARVVDAWRQLRVTANGLMGVFNIQYQLQSQTPPGMHPLAFSSAATNQQLGLNFSLPLARIAQRNAYRTALINYQVARRTLMALEDNIAVQVRFDVRQLQLFNANYNNQKKILKSLYSQVENALELIVAPVDPDQLKGSGTTGAANAAALTSQYLGALNSLNNAQVKMYDIWLSLMATRMQLYLDLERLPLDMRGVWAEGLGCSPASPAALARTPGIPSSTESAVRPVMFLPLPTEPEVPAQMPPLRTPENRDRSRR